jgi:hypothetical protein
MRRLAYSGFDFEVFQKMRGFVAVSSVDNCPVYYSLDFNKVIEYCNKSNFIKSFYWDAYKYDKDGNKQHDKVKLL